jgi:hypothetical protein
VVEFVRVRAFYGARILAVHPQRKKSAKTAAPAATAANAPFTQVSTYTRREKAIDELVDALKFSPALTGPDTCLNGTAADAAVGTRPA